ncbi:hypothetical protein, partial [Solilutibacter silvestris]|uniref:hypothetical protein n=1 Tax=Solilutibacter silvestris TaxID=1645665 RepID=UPI003D3564FC
TQVLGCSTKDFRAMKITDPKFNREITLADAYRVMCKFIEEYNSRGVSSTLDLLSDIGLTTFRDGSSADPAQLQDFLDAANSILKGSAAP